MRPAADDAARRSVALRVIPIVAVATAAALAFLPADQRPVILRVALVAGLALLLMHLVARAAGAFRDDDPEGFERALEPQIPAVRLDASYGQLRDEIRHSRTSRRYFERVLWPRLRALAARPGEAEGELPAPPPHWTGRRGPTLDDISRLVDHLERKK